MRRKITLEEIQRYAVSSGDNAGIHLKDEAAAAAGFVRPIAHGMYLMGLAQSLYLDQRPDCWVNECSMRFQQPLLADTIAAFTFEEQGTQVQVKITAETGEVIAIGDFSVREEV